MELNVLAEPQTYSPKGFFLVVWIITSAMGIVGLALALANDVAAWFWIAILLIGLRQLWVTRWVQVDRGGIRTRNIFGRGRSLPWEGITSFREQTLSIRKGKFFSVSTLEGTSDVRRGKNDTIKLDSDINGYDVLRQIIAKMIPPGAETETDHPGKENQ